LSNGSQYVSYLFTQLQILLYYFTCSLIPNFLLLSFVLFLLFSLFPFLYTIIVHCCYFYLSLIFRAFKNIFIFHLFYFKNYVFVCECICVCVCVCLSSVWYILSSLRTLFTSLLVWHTAKQYYFGLVEKNICFSFTFWQVISLHIKFCVYFSSFHSLKTVFYWILTYGVFY
jgi:hypothetical protein